MHSIKVRIFLTVILLGFKSISGQNSPSLTESENKIKKWFNVISETKNDSVKLSYNDSIINVFDSILMFQESYFYKFENLSFVGKIYSSDKLFRIINWNLSFNNGSYKYFGYIQYYNKKENDINLFPLIDKSQSIENPKQALLTNENWFGALYYKIILNKDGNNNYYTLLGWDGNNDFTNIKLIEVLYFTRSGKPKFGKNLFRIENEKSKRVIFEYNNRATLTLRYDDYLNMIIYEHLSPEKPSQIGQYKFYVPDFSYDGLEFKKGKYIHHSAIDVHDRQTKNKKRQIELKKKRKKDSF